MTEVTILICFESVDNCSGTSGSILVISSNLVFWSSKYASTSFCAFDICWLQTLSVLALQRQTRYPPIGNSQTEMERLCVFLGTKYYFHAVFFIQWPH